MRDTTNSTPLAAAWAARMRQVLLRSACRSKSAFSSATFPASIFEKSRTSSTRPSITRDELRRVCSMSACSRESWVRSEEHTSELQSRLHLVCRLLLEKKKKTRLIAAQRGHVYYA